MVYFSNTEFWKKVPLFITMLVVGFLIGKYTSSEKIIKPIILRETGYKHINPVLLCNTNNNRSDNEDILLSKKLAKYAKSNSDNEISVYFQDLNSSAQWSSLNSYKTYSPASMLKIPTAAEALKFIDSQNENIILEKEFYDGSFDNNLNEHFKPQKYIKAGNYYTIDELLEYMIVYSDNNALKLLNDRIKPTSFDNLYKDLGIDTPKDRIDFMSTKSYSLFLRVLYNGTYLTRESSEKILELMTKTDFEKGIKSGVPNNIEVADKFGEREIITKDRKLIKRELHDCGIVYIPEKPYVLCIMTSGQDFDSLSKNIKEISKIVYNHVK